MHEKDDFKLIFKILIRMPENGDFFLKIKPENLGFTLKTLVLKHVRFYLGSFLRFWKPATIAR